MRFVFSLIAIFVVGAMSFYFSLEYRYRPVIDEVCGIVIENYFNAFSLENFAHECERTKLNFPKFANVNETVKQINSLLGKLETSHLSLYEPVENAKMWLHQSLDNGLRCRDVQGFVVVSEVLPNSPAEKAGFRVGDEVLSVNSEPVRFCSELSGRSGQFSFVRQEHKEELKVLAQAFEENDSLTVTGADRDFKILRVKSFLAAFFSYEDLKKIKAQLAPAKEIIIDLRGNMGGSFPAMLRLLSFFTCEDEFVGKLLVSNRHQQAQEDLLDNLKSESQLEQIARVKSLRLHTSGDEMCIRRHISVLVDHQTSSVSEIFADHLKLTHGAQIFGQQSAGEVVMARWFALISMGHAVDPYSLSVPIADYENSRSQKLEGLGVRPDVYLDYDLETALRGQDSWIDQILKMRHKHLSIE